MFYSLFLHILLLLEMIALLSPTRIQRMRRKRINIDMKNGEENLRHRDEVNLIHRNIRHQKNYHSENL